MGSNPAMGTGFFPARKTGVCYGYGAGVALGSQTEHSCLVHLIITPCISCLSYAREPEARPLGWLALKIMSPTAFLLVCHVCRVQVKAFLLRSKLCWHNVEGGSSNRQGSKVTIVFCMGPLSLGMSRVPFNYACLHMPSVLYTSHSLLYSTHHSPLYSTCPVYCTLATPSCTVHTTPSCTVHAQCTVH